MDVNSLEKQAETFVLLKLLAIGREEIAQGKFRDAESVFANCLGSVDWEAGVLRPMA